MLKESILEGVAEKIYGYAISIRNIEASLEHFGLNLEGSALVNFRDAIFHYQTLYLTEDLEIINENKAAIEEHLERGSKDILIYFSDILRKSITLFLNDTKINKSKENRILLIALCNDFANFNIDLRKSHGRFEIKNLSKRFDEIIIIVQNLILLLETEQKTKVFNSCVKKFVRVRPQTQLT
jgi:hypothetical protein